ncbi:MAG: hypothetical protein WCD88_05175 [Desulfobacterales bacterium]
MMRIKLKEVLPPKTNPQNPAPLPVPSKKEPIRNRRKNKADRRRANRDGVIVTLSTRNDRRSGRDRRKRRS